MADAILIDANDDPIVGFDVDIITIRPGVQIQIEATKVRRSGARGESLSPVIIPPNLLPTLEGLFPGYKAGIVQFLIQNNLVSGYKMPDKPEPTP